MKIYDEENMPYDGEEEEFDGYTLIDDHSIFNVQEVVQEAVREEVPEEWMTPLPENEQTVLLCAPSVAGVKDGAALTLAFKGDGCVVSAKKKIGTFKEAFVKKLKAERGGQSVRAFYKAATPPMVRLMFGEGDCVIPCAEKEQ